MQTLMNCDQVFDALTRGPFGTDHENAESVELHLQSCHSCRQLAEALRPASDLLHESLSEAESEELPVFRPDESALTKRIMRSICELEKRTEPVSASPTHLLAAMAIGIALSLMVVFVVAQDKPDASDLPGVATNDPVSTTNFLNSLNLNEACFRSDFEKLDERFVCCTSCHMAQNEVSDTPAEQVLQHKACFACHSVTE